MTFEWRDAVDVDHHVVAPGLLAEPAKQLTTWLVDRVERRGFAERSAVPGDRRRRAVVLTPAGERIRSELMAGLYAPPAELLELDAESLERLRDGVTAVARITPDGMGGAACAAQRRRIAGT